MKTKILSLAIAFMAVSLNAQVKIPMPKPGPAPTVNLGKPNEFKLKKGFKQLFGNTVFGFYKNTDWKKLKNYLKQMI